MKVLVKIALLGFVVVAALYALGGFAKTDEAPAVGSQASGASDQVIAYYFHTTARCPRCMRFEAWGGEALEQRFSERLKSGALEWKVINVEEAQNRHFVERYKLHTKSIVLSRIRDGKEAKWKNLNRIWDLVGDKEAFSIYVGSETELFWVDGERN